MIQANTIVSNLKYRISILEPIRTKNAKGTEVLSYELLADTFANVYDITYQTQNKEQYNYDVNIKRITIRKNPNVTRDCRIEYDGQVYDITSPIDSQSTPGFMIIIATNTR